MAVSGRADRNPLGPVIAELRAMGCEVAVCDLDSLAQFDASQRMLTAWRTTAMSLALGDPDWFLVLGDRYETLSATLLALVNKAPIAHIHGGEVSEGSFDNRIRNAISMLADKHFVSAEEHRNKLIAMGIDPAAIHVTGPPGLDNIETLPPRMKNKRFVVTYHPATKAEEDVWELLKALDAFPDHEIVFTGLNSDPGAVEIAAALAAWNRGATKPNMQAGTYFALLRESACLVGNSSSAMIEAPSLQVAAVNVGDRQKGRLRGRGVFDAPCKATDIVEAIKMAVDYDGPWDTPYKPGGSRKIAAILSAGDGKAA